jgi:Flp pilus assembly protein TadD
MASDYDQAVRLEPNNAKIRLRRGIARLWLFRDNEAEEDFAKYLQLDPSFKSEIDQFVERIKRLRKTER